MPAAFFGHGSPMNALEENRYTRSWEAVSAGLTTRPKALLVVSAHWYWNATAVTAMARPRTIHDFFGFPADLFAFEYPASGSSELAQQVVDLVQPTWTGLDYDAWGLDHGAWVVLARMFPGADIPVVQLAINAEKSPEYHFELGAKLAALREQGVMIICSGNVVHNLRAVDFSMGEQGRDWAHRFDDVVRETMTSEPTGVVALVEHPDFLAAAPTPDHFIPLLYLAGLAGAASEPTEMVVDGYLAGSLSMTSYVLGGQAPPSPEAPSPEAPSPEAPAEGQAEGV